MAERQYNLRQLRDALKRFGRNDQFILSVLAVVIGGASGGAAIVFRQAIDGVQWLFYGFSSQNVATLAAGLPFWHVLLAPALGGLLIGLFIYFFMPGRRPQAVPDVIEAAADQRGFQPDPAAAAALVQPGQLLFARRSVPTSVRASRGDSARLSRLAG